MNSQMDVFGDVLKKVAEVEKMNFIVFSFIPEKGQVDFLGRMVGEFGGCEKREKREKGEKGENNIKQ